MKAMDREFRAIIDGAKQFEIPVFQRDYSWNTEQCSQLWSDIARANAVSHDRGHFIGSIVYIDSGKSTAALGRWLVVDGQQRLTTITLLMIALRDHIVDVGWTGDDDSPTPALIDACFLKNMLLSGDRRHKLVLRRADNATLQALLDGRDPPDEVSPLIIAAYEHFRELLKDCDPDSVYRGVSHLNIVDVTLTRGQDDPQIIFESLNATGVDLSQSDLVRNYMLMKLTEIDQTRLYNHYWSRVEHCFRGTDRGLDRFLRDYTALQRRESRLIRDDLVYETFKSTFALSDDVGETEAHLADLTRAARLYAAFYSPGSRTSGSLTDAFRHLRWLGAAPALLVLRLHDFHDRGVLSVKELVEALALIESYTVRRAVCDYSARGYWSTFARTALRLTEQAALSDLKVAFARLQGADEYPSNRAFGQALRESDLYHRRVCWHLLSRLENCNQREKSPVENYSIEHIMPQNENLRRAWRDMLGPEWEETRDTWCHRLGNLTLTAYNSRYSDRPFEDKVSMEGGFRQSAVRLNEDVRDRKAWTPAEMEDRGRRLARRALRIWPAIDVDQELVRADVVRELRNRAAERPPQTLKMSSAARVLFQELKERIESLGEVILVIERKSICCYAGEALFLEILPQKWGIKLLADVEFNDVEDPKGLATDATKWKFIPNAAYRGWELFVDMESDEQIDAVMPMVRQAFDLTAR